MALDKNTLQTTLEDCFEYLRTKEYEKDFDGDDYIADKISKAVKSFGESGTVTTTDSGAVSGGTFLGIGKGGLSLSASDCKSIIYNATKEMKKVDSQGKQIKRNDYLAEQLASAFDTMYKQENIVTTKVNGTITPPSGSVITITDADGKGNIAVSFSTLESGLKSLFRNKNFSDDLFASTLANLIYGCVSIGIISTTDEGEITGSYGTGSIA